MPYERYTKEKGLELTVRLTDHFHRNLSKYKSPTYDESDCRQDLVLPLFECLGWDVYNKQQASQTFKEVKYEGRVRVRDRGVDTIKNPDFVFRIGPRAIFFVETKAPHREVLSPTYTFQLRRYAWSMGLPLSILTDFEDFLVYDTRFKPSIEDKPRKALIKHIPYTDYEGEFDYLWETFSHQAVITGSFDNYAEETKDKRGHQDVDDAFLKEMEEWREDLAKNIKLRNHYLNIYQMNEVVQKTLDRIIFLRVCEDRETEQYHALGDITDMEGGTYKNLLKYFRQADERYNAGLFDFEEDKLTPKLTIDDETLNSIIKSLYYPSSPFDFSAIPVEILGQVYEQFLGKTIRVTPKRAFVEDKPEVRKAGGIYYTPKYIVDYIVENTVGRLLEDKTVKQARKLRILDPACGSGSFLLGAYDYLLRWYLERYTENPDEHDGEEIYPVGEDEYRLTVEERKRVLMENIYGVDIDPQAVEVTKLSLHLKVLEGETRETLEPQLSLLRTPALPDLERNIRCGNSLIGPDFYQQFDMGLFDEDERRRINVFDWWDEERGFGEIMESGGFDAVIGNPPYIGLDETWGKGDTRLKYLKNAYSEIYNDKTDILFYFIANVIKISKNFVCFIVSRAFMEAYKADKLRKWISENTNILEIIDFQNYYVFKGVGITTVILTLSICEGKKAGHIYRLKIDDFEPNEISKQKTNKDIFENIEVEQSEFNSEPWIFTRDSIKEVINKIDVNCDKLEKVLFIGQGMQTGRNNIFGKLDEDMITKWKLKIGQYYIRARNSDIFDYYIRNRNEFILYIEEFKKFEDLPEGVQKYLKENESELKKRAAYKRGDCLWWKYTWPLHKEYIDKKRILCPYLAKYNRFALDEENKFLGLTDTTILYENNQHEDLKYLLGLLNSNLLTFRFKYIGKLKSGGILEYFWNSISKIPIKRIDFSNPEDVEIHDGVVRLVERMMDLKKQYYETDDKRKRDRLSLEIKTTDAQIDALVYKLYDLTDDEIAIVEEGVG